MPFNYCDYDPNRHIATSMTEAGLLTVTNSTNISNLESFTLVLMAKPNEVITGAPVNYTLTINGTVATLINRFGLPISSDHLRRRWPYRGAYVVPATGTPYVILFNTPANPAYAISSAEVTTASENEGE